MVDDVRKELSQHRRNFRLRSTKGTSPCAVPPKNMAPIILSCLTLLLLGFMLQPSQSMKTVSRPLHFPCSPGAHSGGRGAEAELLSSMRLGRSKRSSGSHLRHVRRDLREHLAARLGVRLGGRLPLRRDPRPLWACPSEQVWVDLGPHAFPRFVLDRVCHNATCWRGHFHCQAVLATREILVRQNGGCLENRLPPELRRKFMFAEMESTSACTCGR